jgi:hypothetical protein
MVKATAETLRNAEKSAKQDGKTVILDSGDGWKAVIAWDWQRRRVIRYSLNPEGTMIL